MFEFRLLGPVELMVDDRPVAAGPPQRRAVLTALLLDAGQPVSAETLIDRVWGETPPPEVRNTLYSHIARIRGMLADLRRTSGVEADLARRSGGYVLAVDPERVDLFRSRSLIGRARDETASAHDRVTLLREALDLWRGDPLGGVHGSWAERTRETLTEQRLGTLVRWAQLAMDLGCHDEVIEEVGAAISRHPLAEPLVALLMRALFLTGRAAEALACYATVRRRLAEELGVEPGTELRAVHEAMLRGDFHRLRPAGADLGQDLRTPRQLPVDVTPFTGRLAQLAALDALVPAEAGRERVAPICAISGMAGVGKTALAVHWAHRMIDRFPDGQLYLDLRGYDPDRPLPGDEALAALLGALAVTGDRIPTDTAERAALYRTLTAGRRLLVVLDNAADVEQIRHLLPGSSSCFTLVTSRDHLAALVARYGATRVDLDMLSTDEAVALLDALTGDPAVADPIGMWALVERCARLPLALRIAAEYLTAHPGVTAIELAEDLADEQHRLDLLDASGAERTAVRAVFSWSYGRLSEPAASAFRLLGLHPGRDLDLHASAALLGTDSRAARRLLATLAAAHLVVEVSPGRYGMHDLLRAYARERAALDAPTDQRDALPRLVDHYLTVAAKALEILVPHERHMRPPVPTGSPTTLPSLADPASALAWLDANRSNLVAMTRWAGEHEDVTRFSELSGVLWRYFEQGAHHAEAIAINSAALDAAVKTGDRATEAESRRRIGVIYGRRGNYEAAVGEARLALALFDELGDRMGAGRSCNNLGAYTAQLHRHAESHGYLTRALGLFDRIGERTGYSITMSNLAFLLEHWGRYDESMRAARDALDVLAEVNDYAGTCRTLVLLGSLQERRGHLHEALELYRRCLTVLRERGIHSFEGQTLGKIAKTLQRLGRHREAIETASRALTASRTAGSRDSEAAVLEELGNAYRHAGETDQARTHLSAALDLAVALGNRGRETSALNGLGELLHGAGRLREAYTHHRTALAVASEISDRAGEARAYHGMGGVALDAGRPDEARSHWHEALDRYEAMKVPEADEIRARLANLPEAASTVR